MELELEDVLASIALLVLATILSALLCMAVYDTTFMYVRSMLLFWRNEKRRGRGEEGYNLKMIKNMEYAITYY